MFSRFFIYYCFCFIADEPPKKESDPIESAGLYEGDIILKTNKEEDNPQRNGIINERAKWPQGQIPYVISSDFSKKDNENGENSNKSRSDHSH